MVVIQGRDPVDENTPGLINARALRELRSNCELFEERGGDLREYASARECTRAYVCFAGMIDDTVIDANASDNVAFTINGNYYAVKIR